jgi:hypothetical protein
MIKYQGVADLGRLETLAQKGHARLFYASIPNDYVSKPKTQFDIDYMRELFAVGLKAGEEGVPVTPILAGRQ